MSDWFALIPRSRTDSLALDVPPEARTDNADGGTMDFDPTEWPKLTSRMDAMEGSAKDMLSRLDAYCSRMDAFDEKMGPMLKKWAEQEAGEAEHRGDSATAWRSVLTAADAHKVEIADTATLADARKAVGAAIVGKERADALSADALDVAIELASKPRTDSMEGWAASFRSVPVTQPDDASRQDATVPTNFRGA